MVNSNIRARIMSKFIITFGQIHVHSIAGKTFDKNCVAVIGAEDYIKARAIAMDIFKGVFCQCIPEKKFDADGDIKYFPRGKMEVN